ncbi:unnamed protein product [Camellia sinensis]
MEESKATTTKDNNIPLIDLSLLNSPNNSSSADSIASLAAEITEACETWGCFQVINHGVPVEQSQAIESASRQFFDQPKEEKKKVWRYERNPLGYHDSEITMNVRDWKEVFDFTVQNPTLFPASPDPHDLELRELVNQWPQFPPQFREVCEEYAKEIEKLGYQLLELLSLSLGLPRQRLNHFFKDQTSIVRFNHYPPCPNHPGQVLGVGQHTDSGALSILAQDDVGGLQVKRKWDGKWVPVKPNPHAYIVIICDIFQVWSNDKYESVVHRAMVNSEKERISIVFFFYPAHYTMVEPLEELINDRNPPKYRPYNWGKFSAARWRSNFTKNNVGRIQIDHFKFYDQIQPNKWTYLPESSDGVTNSEVKSINGCANPYLVMASITAAGIDGLRRNLILPEPWEHPMLILKKVIWCLFVLFMLVENVLPQSDAEMLFNYETENLGTELQRLPATLIESVEALQKDNLLGNLVSEIFQKLKYKFGRYAEIDYHSQNKDAYKQQSYRTVLLNW